MMKINVLSKNTVAAFLVFFMCLCNLMEIYNIAPFMGLAKTPLQVLFVVVLVAVLLSPSTYQRPVSPKKFGLILFVALFSFYLTSHMMIESGQNTASLFNIFSNSFFSMIVFFFFALSPFDKSETSVIQQMAVLFIVLFVLLYVTSLVSIPITADPRNIYHAQYVNSIYYSVLMLPFVLNNKKKNAFIVLVLICCLLSRKQGAFLAISIGGGISYLLNKKVNKSNSFSLKKVAQFFFLTTLAFFAYQKLSDYLSENILYGFFSITEDGGNGRLDIYQNILSTLTQSSLPEIIFGHGGYNAVNTEFGISAHNDFLEVLYNYGAIGLLLYGTIAIFFVALFVELYKKRSSELPAFSYALIAFFIISFVSHLLFILKYAMLLFAYFGMVVSAEERNFNERNCKISE
ncbi:O-antigen ligase family protein [Fibrobacter sp.]|uniref:O-antigen ligase family protein n=1 Tax=Fibrobacter sp. TaxID=35828 RepID=UPI003890FC82